MSTVEIISDGDSSSLDSGGESLVESSEENKDQDKVLNPFEGLNRRALETPKFTKAQKRAMSMYNTMEFDGLRYEYEIANHLELLATNSDLMLQITEELAQSNEDWENMSSDDQHLKYTEKLEELANKDDSEWEEYLKGKTDPVVAYRSLILNKLVSLYDVEEELELEIDPQFIWSLDSMIAQELYARICGTRTDLSDYIDKSVENNDEDED